MHKLSEILMFVCLQKDAKPLWDAKKHGCTHCAAWSTTAGHWLALYAWDWGHVLSHWKIMRFYTEDQENWVYSKRIENNREKITPNEVEKPRYQRPLPLISVTHIIITKNCNGVSQYILSLFILLKMTALIGVKFS